MARSEEEIREYHRRYYQEQGASIGKNGNLS